MFVSCVLFFINCRTELAVNMVFGLNTYPDSYRDARFMLLSSTICLPDNLTYIHYFRSKKNLIYKCINCNLKFVLFPVFFYKSNIWMK